MWGSFVEHEVHEATIEKGKEYQKNKRKIEQVFERIFGDNQQEEVDGKPQPGRFRDPAEMLNQR